MKCLVDTSVWSLALRRQPPGQHLHPIALKKLNTLLEEGERIFLTGIIIQETLQGIKKRDQFVEVYESLSSFPVLDAAREDHVLAAELFNTCRTKGVQASTVDFLIAALSIRNDCHLLTTDKDFTYIAAYTKLKLL